MRDPVLGDGRENRSGINTAQAHMGPRHCRHCPRIGPAIAVKHREGPQIDRVAVEPERDRIADCIQKGAAMVVHDALRVAGRPGSVIERDRLPFVLRPGPTRRGIAFAEKAFVVRPAERCTTAAVINFDQGHWSRQLVQCLPDDRCEFPVGDQQSGLSMRQDERDRARVEAIVHCVEHRARHRHAVMRFEQCRHIRRHDGDRIAARYPAPAQGVGKSASAFIEPVIGQPCVMVDDRELVGIDRGGPRQETQGAQRGEIRRVPSEVRRVIERPTMRGFVR